MRSLVNFLYRTRSRVAAFNSRFPGETVLFAGGSKGFRRKKELPARFGPEWIFSRRAVLILSDHRLVAGNWNIPLDSIRAADLYDFRGLYSRGLLLKIETSAGEFFQFGLMHDDTLLEQSALPLTAEPAKLSFSVVSVLIRLLAACYLGFYIYRYWL